MLGAIFPLNPSPNGNWVEVSNSVVSRLRNEGHPTHAYNIFNSSSNKPARIACLRLSGQKQRPRKTTLTLVFFQFLHPNILARQKEWVSRSLQLLGYFLRSCTTNELDWIWNGTYKCCGFLVYNAKNQGPTTWHQHRCSSRAGILHPRSTIGETIRGISPSFLFCHLLYFLTIFTSVPYALATAKI